VIYSPGQSVAAEALVTNNSDIPISLLRVQLVKVLTLRATHGLRHNRSRKIFYTVDAAVLPVNIVKGQSMPIAVPVVLPSKLAAHFSVNSELLQCDYSLRIETVTSSPFASNVVLAIPFLYEDHISAF
jgi:hypothetical protein